MLSRRPRAIADAGDPTTRGALYHILYTLTVCAVGMSMPFVFGSGISAIEWLTIVPTLLLANIVEYGVHRWLSIHHNIHHDHDEMTRCNYNFVIPLSDWLLGTSNIQPRSRFTAAK
jgi:hypothetical protein